ncbi:MAG: hypothetical protein PHP85_08615 [Gallionella sp.]|nr:hypothetical protein [Gallionella sp.]
MRDSSSSINGEHLSVAARLQQAAHHRVLGALCFAAETSNETGYPQIPCMSVPMQRLDTNEPVLELWHGSGELAKGLCGDIHYSHDDNVLFGVIALNEALFDATDDKTPLQQATASAYCQIFALLDAMPFPYLFRVWNYIARINEKSFDLERYQQFNRGRQEAFMAHGRDVMKNAPAACALGVAQGPLTIAFLAGRTRPLNLENPRQISACEYPPQYGPRSPIFSRASLVRMGQNEVLFISGTASIVGHATLHAGDVVAQTRETMNNIKAVLVEVNRHQTGFDPACLSYKVYVRHPADFELIRDELARSGGAPKAVYLRADICRQDLLVEIEATAIRASCSGQVN